ncbi:MAG: hypothetical protein HXY34_04895 [Candidatus Thorarchaeota archaeon]|nr:hypothetical protein [Candidatus Thorarchaeota archaeon]
MMRPDRVELVSLLVLISLMSTQLIVIPAPGFVLLALLCKYKDHKYAFLLLSLIGVIKEVIGFVALITLFLYGSRSRAVLGGVLMAGTYALVWLVMGPSDAAPGGTPLFTPFYVVQVLQTSWAISAAVFTAAILSAFVMVVRDLRGVAVLMVLVAPIFLFGFFWEPQLWLPAMIVLQYRARCLQPGMPSRACTEEDRHDCTSGLGVSPQG